MWCLWYIKETKLFLFCVNKHQNADTPSNKTTHTTLLQLFCTKFDAWTRVLGSFPTAQYFRASCYFTAFKHCLSAHGWGKRQQPLTNKKFNTNKLRGGNKSDARRQSTDQSIVQVSPIIIFHMWTYCILPLLTRHQHPSSPHETPRQGYHAT